MVKKGELISEALSGVSDDILKDAQELFEADIEEAAKGKVSRVREIRAVRKRTMISFFAAAAACILLVLCTISMGGLFGTDGPTVYLDGVRIDSDGVTAVGPETLQAAVQDGPETASYTLERGISGSVEKFTFHIKAEGSFEVEALSGELLPDGITMLSAEDEADIVWSAVLEEGAALTVSAGTRKVSIRLHYDDKKGQWVLVKGE